MSSSPPLDDELMTGGNQQSKETLATVGIIDSVRINAMNQRLDIESIPE